jgi:hypothetical protein
VGQFPQTFLTNPLKLKIRILKGFIRSGLYSHERQNPPFLGVLSALVKDSRQFKQREKRLLNVVNLRL